MAILFDLANLAAGLLLAVGVLKSMNIDLPDALTEFLTEYRWIIGAICLVLGVLFLLQGGYLFHDVVGIFAGLLLLGDRLKKVAGIGDHLLKASKALVPFEAIVGVCALIVGLFGILGISLFA